MACKGAADDDTNGGMVVAAAPVTKKLFLRSSEGEEFELAAMSQSLLIKNVIEQDSASSPVVIRNAPSRVLSMILEYLNKHAAEQALKNVLGEQFSGLYDGDIDLVLMQSSCKKNETKGSFIWSNEEAILLCDICLEYISQNGRGRTFKWRAIQKKFEEKSKRKCRYQCCKNKYDSMRRDWMLWKSLIGTETDLGWDPTTRSLHRSDEWWQKKIKENKDLKKFRGKGLDPCLKDKCEQLFGDLVTNEKEVCTSSLDPTTMNIQELANVEEQDQEHEYEQEQEHETKEEKEEVNFEDEKSQLTKYVDTKEKRHKNQSALYGLQGNIEAVNPNARNGIQAPKETQKSNEKTDNGLQVKRKRMEFLTGVENFKQSNKIVNPGTQSTERMSSAAIAMQIINRMHTMQGFESGSQIWCYAVYLVTNADMRDVFLNMEDDESRLSWIHFMFTMKNK